MQLCSSMTGKVLVWLAAILVPAESLPLMACNCADQPAQAPKPGFAPAKAAPVATCPHCTDDYAHPAFVLRDCRRTVRAAEKLLWRRDGVNLWLLRQRLGAVKRRHHMPVRKEQPCSRARSLVE